MMIWIPPPCIHQVSGRLASSGPSQQRDTGYECGVVRWCNKVRVRRMGASQPVVEHAVRSKGSSPDGLAQ